MLCSAPGTSCRVSSLGASSFSGTCAALPALSDVVYGAAGCTVGDPFACQFNNPLAASPYSFSQLQCVPSTFTTAGVCALGPQMTNDGCNLNAECASNNCQKRGGANCVGAGAGEPCSPPSAGGVDPCAAGYYCVGSNSVTGMCAKLLPAGSACSVLRSCAPGSVCAGSGAGPTSCVPYLSVPTGNTTTVGPYMCATGTGLLVRPASGSTPATWRCTTAADTAAQVGKPCNPAAPATPGLPCTCASDGTTRTSTAGGASHAGCGALLEPLSLHPPPPLSPSPPPSPFHLAPHQALALAPTLRPTRRCSSASPAPPRPPTCPASTTTRTLSACATAPACSTPATPPTLRS